MWNYIASYCIVLYLEYWKISSTLSHVTGWSLSSANSDKNKNRRESSLVLWLFCAHVWANIFFLQKIQFQCISLLGHIKKGTGFLGVGVCENNWRQLCSLERGPPSPYKGYFGNKSYKLQTQIGRVLDSPDRIEIRKRLPLLR